MQILTPTKGVLYIAKNWKDLKKKNQSVFRAKFCKKLLKL